MALTSQTDCLLHLVKMSLLIGGVWIWLYNESLGVLKILGIIIAFNLCLLVSTCGQTVCLCKKAISFAALLVFFGSGTIYGP
jgi:hypothetical protein